MSYLLDTNAVIAIMRRNHRVGERIRRYQAEQVGMSSIVMHELYFGAFNSSRVEANLALLKAIDLPIVPFEAEDARIAGEIRASLIAAGTPIDPLDTLIAGQAMARDLVLVTHNTREFSRVDGLRLEDWEA